MGSDLVSVIVPTFNRSALVRRAIDSALAQTHPNMEVVVVDDGSTDDTPAVLRRGYAGDRRVKVIQVENGGVSRARNIAIANATGDFVAFLDSDDYWLPWKIDLQLKCLERSPRAGMIWTDMDAVTGEGAVIQRCYLRTMYGTYGELLRLGVPLFKETSTVDAGELGIAGLSGTFELSQGDIFSQMVVGSVVHTSTCLLRRERLEKVGRFREDMLSGEDYEFHLRTCREGTVAFADIASIGYTIGRSDQLTSPSRIVHVALNSLRTMDSILAESRHLIDLPPGTIARVRSGRHAWAARELLEQGRRGAALGHALKSIALRPLAPHPYALLGAALLPTTGLNALLALRRRGRKIRARLRGRVGAG